METNLKYEEWWPSKCKYRMCKAEAAIKIKQNKNKKEGDIYSMKGWSCTVLQWRKNSDS